MMKDNWESPVIIIGAARSGTTLLGEILSSHPSFCYWLEPKYIWRYGNAGATDDVRTAEEASEDVRQYIRKRFRQYLTEQQGEVILEKTPSNCFRVPFIDKVFPEARYIHLVRDGRKVTLSAMQKWTSPPDKSAVFRRFKLQDMPVSEIPYYGLSFLRDIVGRAIMPSRGFVWGPHFPGMKQYRKEHTLMQTCALQWAKSVQAAMEGLADVDKHRIIHIRYEDLVSQPLYEIERIMAFLELSDSKSLNRAIQKIKSQRADITTVEIEQISSVTDILSDQLKVLGYA